MKVFKRNGNEQDFNVTKITNAVSKANNAVEEQFKMPDDQVQKVVDTVMKKLEKFDTIKVEDIQDMVEASLVKHNKYEVAKAYIIYRQKKRENKKFTESEEKTLAIIAGTSAEARGDNANKHIDVNSSVRDYIAGTTCKEIAEKILPKDVLDAHKKGLIHWHDMDYSPVMNLTNCGLVDVKSMLLDGFMMGDTWIDRPKRFSTACNLAAQIALIVSGSQYGGQTMSWAHLLPFIDSTRDDCKLELLNIMSCAPKFLQWACHFFYNAMVEKMVKRDIHIGVKTYQYQILCHHSSNGQTPFVSNVLCLREAQSEYDRKWLAFIIEEVINRRIKGVKDKSGHYVSPLFPKLLYWTSDGLNVNRHDPYYYLTKLAAKCVVNRMQPDIMSEKKGREIKAGQVIPVMGCVDGSSIIKVKINEIEYADTFENLWNTLSLSNEVKPQFGIENNDNLIINLNNVLIWDNKENKYVKCQSMNRNISNNWVELTFDEENIIEDNEDFELE